MSKFVIFLNSLVQEVGEFNFKEIFQMAADDISFNRTSFGKSTDCKYFMTICTRCKEVFIRY